MKRVLIKCGWLVTLDPAIGDFKGGEVLFRGNRIEAVGRNLDAAADEVIDATNKIVMPGMVSRLMIGLLARPQRFTPRRRLILYLLSIRLVMARDSRLSAAFSLAVLSR